MVCKIYMYFNQISTLDSTRFQSCVPAGSLPTLDHVKTKDSTQKAVAERVSELQHLNLTGMSQKIKSQHGVVKV